MKYKSSIITPIAFLAGLYLSGCSNTNTKEHNETQVRTIEGTPYIMKTDPSRIHVINLRRVIQNYTSKKEIEVREDLENGLVDFPNLPKRTLNEVLMNVDLDADSVITRDEISSALNRYKETKSKVPII